MRYAKIRKMDISNGIGIACSLFTQGCSAHCKGCFNTDTWDFNGGKEWNDKVEDEFIKLCKKPYIQCVSLLGGEPLDNPTEILKLVKRIKAETGKPIFVWSGYTFEEIRDDEYKFLILNYVDTLIDGKFEIDKQDITLKLRGSSNQRIIDVQKTLKLGKIILKEWDNE